MLINVVDNIKRDLVLCKMLDISFRFEINFELLEIFSYVSNKIFHSNLSVERRVDASKQNDGHEGLWLLFCPTYIKNSCSSLGNFTGQETYGV